MSTRKANSRHWFSTWKKETYVPYWQVWKLEPAAGSSIRTTKRERQERDDVDSSSSDRKALVFRVEKGDIRSVLASLEARTGRRIEYQDNEARKAGKG